MRILKIVLTTGFIGVVIAEVIMAFVLKDSLTGIAGLFVPFVGVYIALLGIIESIEKKAISMKVLIGGGIIMIWFLFILSNAWHGG